MKIVVDPGDAKMYLKNILQKETYRNRAGTIVALRGRPAGIIGPCSLGRTWSLVGW